MKASEFKAKCLALMDQVNDGDPVDRVIIATALEGSATLVTADSNILA